MKVPYQITLRSGEQVLVDEDSYKLVAGYKWGIQRTQGKCYAVRSYWDKEKKAPRTISMHRQIMGLVAGDGYVIDHINGETLDNRRSNLRVCTQSQNLANSKARNPKSSFKGVIKAGGKWCASITKNRHQTHLGTFESAEAASAAYMKAAESLFGEFASDGSPK